MISHSLLPVPRGTDTPERGIQHNTDSKGPSYGLLTAIIMFHNDVLMPRWGTQLILSVSTAMLNTSFLFN